MTSETIRCATCIGGSLFMDDRPNFDDRSIADGFLDPNSPVTTLDDLWHADAIYGREDGEGLLLISGTLRRVIRCHGLELLAPNQPAREQLALALTARASKAHMDIQVVAGYTAKESEELIGHYRKLLKTEVDFIQWCGEESLNWHLARIEELRLERENEFYLIISYVPPDASTVVPQVWQDSEIQLPPGTLSKFQQQHEIIFAILRSCGLQPSIVS